MTSKQNIALQTLRKLLGMENVEHFLSKVYEDKPYVISTDNKALSSLISYEEVSEILLYSRHYNPGLRLAKNGNIISPEEYTFSYSNFQGSASPLICHKAVYDLFLEGATIVYDNIEEKNKKILDVIKSFEYLLNEYCSAHLYVSKEEETGLDIHWDDHDVVVLQLHGQKAWSIFNKDIEHPIRADRKVNPGKPGKETWRGTLHSGDILFLPRGYWHLPEATGEQCCHISIAIDRKIGKQYVSWLIDQLFDDQVLRKNVPNKSCVRKSEFLNEIKNTFVKNIEKKSVDQYRSALLTHSRPRPFYDFLVSDKEMVEIILDSNNYFFVLESRFPLNIDYNEDQVWFYQYSKKFIYPIQARNILIALANNHWVSSYELQSVNQRKCTHEEIKLLLSGLIYEGVGRIAKEV